MMKKNLLSRIRVHEYKCISSTVQPFNRSTCVSYKESEKKRKYKQHKEHHGMVDPSFLMEQTTSIHENCQTGIAGIMG